LLGKYAKANKQVKNKMANCLKSILADKKLLVHFHPRHLESSTYLRHAWIKYEQEKEAREY